MLGRFSVLVLYSPVFSAHCPFLCLHTGPSFVSLVFLKRTLSSVISHAYTLTVYRAISAVGSFANPVLHTNFGDITITVVC